MAKAKKKPVAKTAADEQSAEAKTRITTMTPDDIEGIGNALRDWAAQFDAQAVKMRLHNQPNAEILGFGLVERSYENLNLFLGRVVAKVKQTDTPPGVK